ncbi:SAM-dependent methyltransferase [Streptomyces sp. NPDC092903]|uniref:SAM-dependent methyltransferase n=1 Tax=Streptomyces sp. NPDC092903 TaxID=3366017 RepID=UPI0038117A36
MTATTLRPQPLELPLGASPPRMADYVLGGGDHLPADRTAVREIMRVAPWYEDSVRINHAYTLDTAQYLTTQAGIGQFLDIGSALLSRGPGYTDPYPRLCSVLRQSTVVHVDTDSRTGSAPRSCTVTSPGRHHYVQASAVRPLELLRTLTLNAIDRSQPVGVLMHGLGHWITSDADLKYLLDEIRAWLPPGSALSLTHATADLHPDEANAAARIIRGAEPGYRPRTHDEIQALLDPWPLCGPRRLVPVSQFHRQNLQVPADRSGAYAAIALHPHIA